MTNPVEVNPEVTDPAAKQFPSEVGAPKVEVSERSADQERPSDYYVKEFIIKGRDLKADKELHERNSLAVLNEAIQRGLHPKGDVKLVKATNLDDGINSSVTYKVEVVPAHVDHVAGEANTPTKALAE